MILPLLGILLGGAIGLLSAFFTLGVFLLIIRAIWDFFTGATGMTGEDVADKAGDWITGPPSK